MAEADTNAVIAEALHVSRGAVEKHVNAVFDKLVSGVVLHHPARARVVFEYSSLLVDFSKIDSCRSKTGRHVRQGVVRRGVSAGISCVVPADSVCESAARSRSFSSLSLSLSG